MFHRHDGSENKTRRSGWPQPSQNPFTRSAEERHSKGHHTDGMIFPMSLQPSASNTPQMSNPARRTIFRRNRASSTDLRSPVTDSSPPLDAKYLNTARFSEGSTSSAQQSMTSIEFEDPRPVRPRHNPIPPQQPGNHPSFHVNPKPRRILTAADFSRRHSLSSRSSSGSSSHSGQSSAGSLTHLPPPFVPPISSTRPIPIPQANLHTDQPFTPQRPVVPQRRRRHRKNTGPPLSRPNN